MTTYTHEEVKDLIDDLNSRIEHLESINRKLYEENCNLRDENDAFYEENMHLRAEIKHHMIHSARSQTHARPLLDRRLESARSETSERPSLDRRIEESQTPKTWLRRTIVRPPRSSRRGQLDSGTFIPTPTRTGQLRSRHFGRGLPPEEHPETPQPEKSQGAAPGFDLGYINQVDEDKLHTLPYGLIILNAEGDVLFYNETESRLAGFARERVTGKNFFREVAPCTRVREFEGRFKEFAAGKLGRVTFFDFAFHFEKGTQRVLIGLSPGRVKGQINVMLMRR